ICLFFFSSRRRHTRSYGDWSSDVCSSDLGSANTELVRSTSLYLFAQDSWKFKPNVSLNYGLRWEMNTPLTDIGKKVQRFNPGQRSEERRVGKEGRSRWSTDHEEKKW